MSALRLIRDDGCSARGNVSLTAAMVELHRNGAIPDTLRVYRYPDSVLLGRNQNAEEAADLAACRERSIEIARRITGGGAVYMDRGVITWDLVIAGRAGGDPRRLSEKVCTAMAERISAFGMEACFRPENDVVAGGRKIVGASGYADGASLVYQGSLMVSPNLEAMAAALRIPLPALRRHVTTLEVVLGRQIGFDEASGLIEDAISAALDRSLVEGELTSEEFELRDSVFATEYGRGDFVFACEEKAAA